MYGLNRIWFFTSLIILVIGGQACEKFAQSKVVNEPKPVIVVDPNLGANYIPMKNIEAVINFRIQKNEDLERIIPVGSAAFLKKPVSGIDPRVIAQDLPYSCYNLKVAKEKAEAKNGKKLTDKERKTVTRLSEKPAEIEYDTEKITNFNLNFNFPSYSDSYLPSEFSFKMQKDNSFLTLVGVDKDYFYDSNEIQAKFGAKSTAKIAGLGFSGKEVKNQRLTKAASASGSPAGFDFPKQFFMKNQTDEVPTDLGSSIAIDTSKGMTFTWLNNSQAGSNSFMNIRIYVLNPESRTKDDRYLNMLSMDWTDNGEATVTPESLEKLGVDKEVQAEVYMNRIIPYGVNLAENATQESSPEKEKSVRTPSEAELLTYSDEQLLAYLESVDDKSADDTEREDESEDSQKIGKPDTDVPVAVFLVSIGTTGIAKVAPPEKK